MQPTQSLNKAAHATEAAVAQSQTPPAKKTEFDWRVEIGGYHYAAEVEKGLPFRMS